MTFQKLNIYSSYLQQLVTAQATRNRELENQLGVYRGSSLGTDKGHPEEVPLPMGLGMGMLLHADLSAGGAYTGGLVGVREEEDDDLMMEERDGEGDGVGMRLSPSDGSEESLVEERERGRRRVRGAGAVGSEEKIMDA